VQEGATQLTPEDEEMGRQQKPKVLCEVFDSHPWTTMVPTPINFAKKQIE
jgi:hypothetical protein